MSTTLKVTMTFHIPLSQLLYGEHEPKDFICNHLKTDLMDTTSKGWQTRRWFTDSNKPTEVKVEASPSITVPNSWSFPE